MLISAEGRLSTRCRSSVSSKQSFVLALADQRIDLATPAADSCGWNLLDGINTSIDLRRAETPNTQVGARPSSRESRMTT